MKKTNFLSHLFHKSAFVRALSLVFVIAIILGGIFIFKYETRPIPFIDAITPPVGQPGDIVVISGRNFGKERDMNYVEFSGSKLTSSSYLMWTDNTIKVIIPANVQDGLVVVGSGKLRSKPAFFANASEIPVAVKESPVSTEPIITSILEQKAQIGSLITISGNNFGDSRNQSKVYFTADYDEKIWAAEYPNITMYTENMIPASDDDFNYEYWSNSEIRLRVPDGASDGVVVIETLSGKSEPFKYTLDSRIGHKAYKEKKIYLIQYTVDLADVVSRTAATITLRCPIPVVNANQNSLQLTEVSPTPVLENYQKTLIHQLVLHQATTERNFQEKQYFRQTFVLPVYGISTKVNEDRVSPKNTPMPDVLYAVATRPDELIPASNSDIINLAQTICGSEKNPYKKAKLIYKYMISNYEVESKYRKNDANPLDLLKSKKGDAYDFAIIYTALLRAADVPAFADCGILVSPDMMARNHAWAEFYISGIGWIPVDVALGAGMEYNKWNEEIDAETYYFGNLDSHHVKFSRGLNSLKPFSQDSKIVQRPRSFAFQSIWEEASNNMVKYSSFWSDPVVKGIY